MAVAYRCRVGPADIGRGVTLGAPQRTPRSTWIEAGLHALASGGPDAVRVDRLAKALGVTRGGFYWHFADRQAFLDEMLDAWEQASTADVVGRVETKGGDARRKIRRAGALTFEDDLLEVDLAVRNWSRSDAAVAQRLRRVDNRRMEYLRSLFREVCNNEKEIEGRSMLAFSLAIGHHLIAADHEAQDHRAAVDAAARVLWAGLGT